MIIVVEGVSASGKTTWCRTHFSKTTIGELPPARDAEASLDVRSRHQFWAERNSERWRAAVTMEGATGIAVCDTDPFKLHYSWSLWRIGEVGDDEWREGLAATRRCFAAQTLGLADLILVADADLAELERRRDSDLSESGRRRRTFDLHVRLTQPLREWYEAVERLEPGRVRWELSPDGGLAPLPDRRASRSGTGQFDALIAQLPQR